MLRHEHVRRAPPDYTKRGVRLCLFAGLAAILFTAAFVERRVLQPIHQPLRSEAERESKQPEVADSRLAAVQVQNTAASSPREILQRYNIDETRLNAFVSEAELSPAEKDLVVKILYHFPRIGLANLVQWREQHNDWDQVAAAPAEHRWSVFRLAGRVKRVEKQALRPEQVERFEFGHFYLITMNLEDSPYLATIGVRRVPEAWPLDQAIDEPAQADGLFLKSGVSASNTPRLIFAAGHLAWFPDRSSGQDQIGPSQLALARMGVDIGLWDDVRRTSGQPLTAADREPFYQLLAAFSRPEARQLTPEAPGALNVVRLLEKPAEHMGDLWPVEGTARRVVKVAVSDADIQRRYGIDHYFEIDMFVPLGDASVRLGSSPNRDENPVYRNSFPATLVVRKLPAGLTEEEILHERIRASAVFFKVWAYPSRFSGRFGQLQPAPLFIAAGVQVVSVDATTNWLTSALILVSLAIVLGVALIVGWVYRREDRAGRRRSRSESWPEALPDFSRLR